MEYSKINISCIYSAIILVFFITYWSVKHVSNCEIMGDNTRNNHNMQIKYSKNELLSYRNISPSLKLDTPKTIPKELKKKKRGKRAGARVRNSKRKNKPFVPAITFGNCRSLHPKIDELRANCKFLYQYREACCLAFTETWLNNKMTDSSLEIPGFTLVRADRTEEKSGKKKGGGVAIYINENWCNNINIEKQHCCPNIEFLSVSLRPKYLPREFTNVYITVVYIPPSADKTIAANLLKDNISVLEDKKPESLRIILGDMNRCDPKLLGYTQQVKCETRDKAILDHLYCNVPGYRSNKVSPLGNSDHNMIHMTPIYKRKLKAVRPTERTITKQTEDTFNLLNDCFETTNWNVFAENAKNIDELTITVNDYIKFNEEMFSEKKVVKDFGNDKPWINSSLRKKIVEKHQCYSKNDSNYNEKQKEVKEAIDEAKKQYKEKVEEHFKGNSMRDAWKGIRVLTGQDKAKKESPLLQEEGSADRLNSFYARFDDKDFTAEHTKLRESLETAIKDAPKIEIEDSDIIKVFGKIKTQKAAGPDKISPLLLKKCLHSLLPIIRLIFQQSLDNHDLPAIWKLGEIIPASKIAIAKIDNDLRPVTLTCILVKCLERIILAKIKEYILKHLDPLQFAYLPNRTTGDAINTLLDFTTSHLDQNPSNYVRSLFLDFSSAFNTMQPHLLINKLAKYGLPPSLQLWILNFLTNRTQYVKTSNGNSSPITINTGAPQGCVLSAFLFIVYTNDLCINDENVKGIKYADDTVVQGLIKNNDESSYFKIITYAIQWCKENFLILNVAKTKEMIHDFRRSKSEMKQLTIDGQEVTRCSEYKYLGYFIQDDLKCNGHIGAQMKKCNKRLFLLRILNNLHVDGKILALYYNSMIVSILTYVITAWYTSCGSDLLREIARIEKRGLRLIKKEFHHLIQHPETIYKSSAIATTGKILNDPLHPLHNKFNYLPHGKRLRVPQCRTKRYQNTSVPSLIKVFNQQ